MCASWKGRRQFANKNVRTLWSYYFEGDVELPEICIDSINYQCPDEREGCSRLHAKKKWHWQILRNNEWYNLLEAQSDRLERSFLNVDTDEVVIPPLNPLKIGKQGQELIKILGTSPWRADFKLMKIIGVNHSDNFYIRRLSTPSKEKVNSKYSTDFTWFLKEEECWVEFGYTIKSSMKKVEGSSSLSATSTLSNEIENQFCKEQSSFMTVNVAGSKCKLDFVKMELKFKKSREVVPVRRRPRNDDIVYPTVWSYYIEGHVEIPEICMNTIGDACALEHGCGRLHCSHDWHWQFLYEGIWYNIPKLQREALEEAYLNVWEDSAVMPAINAPKMGNLGEAMLKMLGPSKLLAEFDSMTMTSFGHTESIIEIRRLSAPSVLKSVDKNAVQFVWFFKNIDEVWEEFGSFEDGDDICPHKSSLTSSYDVEKCYLRKWDLMKVIITDGAFELNFSTMALQNSSSHKVIPVRRRPQYSRSGQIDLRTKRNVTLSVNSQEYNKVRNYLLLSLELPEIISIKRIQNPKLWKMFKKRQDAVSSSFGSDLVLNIHTLFHWVAVDVVDDICKKNFLWNHQCPEVRMKHGKGVKFYRSAKYHHEDCTSERDHRLLVFKVLVGKIKDTKEKVANEVLSTEVDNCYLPNTFLKYDQYDYCPEYIIKL